MREEDIAVFYSNMSSAIKLVHTPTGLTTFSIDGRTYRENIDLAEERLKELYNAL